MQRYLAGRIVQAVISVLGVVTLIFVITRLVGDPVLMLLPPDAAPDQYEILKHQLGLDQSLLTQYVAFLRNAITGDFGKSFRWAEPALPLVLTQLPATLELTAAAMLVAVGIGLPVGILSAAKPGSIIEKAGKAFALLGQSLPVFWIGLMLIMIFAVMVQVFPTGGRGDLRNLVLPAITLGWFSAAAIARLTRSSMLDVMSSDFIKMARIKGVPEFLILCKHALKNASIPVVTLVGLQLGQMLSGAVVTETIFSWPGMGRMAVEAISARDYPLVQATVFVTSSLFIGINLFVDMLYAYLDPRIRFD